MAERNEAPRRGERKVRVGFLLLPPDGVEARKWIAEDLRNSWRGVGTIETRTVQLGDKREELLRALKKWSGRDGLEVICTVGRGGHRREDFAPEATRSLLDRTLPGIEERMYLSSPRRPEDLLFRGAAGMRRGSIIVNLPARRGRVRTILRFLAPVMRHALDKIAGDTGECAAP